MGQDIIDKRTKAIANMGDMLLHLAYTEYILQDKFINGIGDPSETRNELDENYNQRNEIVEDYVHLTNHPFDKIVIDKYMNYELKDL